MAWLVDTHAFLWYAQGDDNLSQRARATLDRDSSETYLSMASVWEMSIKISLGKLRVAPSLNDLVDIAASRFGFRPLDIKLEHVLPVQTLEFHHRDPFDRLLVAQCMAEDLSLISADTQFDAYSIDRIW
jgi:PIN domain nuclease of toxin-antitoxin system